MSLRTETYRLTPEALTFRLKGKTQAGKRWNEHYARLLAEYETALGHDDDGWAASTAAEVEKALSGIQRLAELMRPPSQIGQ